MILLMISPLVVLWLRGGRVGSIALPDLDSVKTQFCLSFMQRDITGCEHWSVLGVIPREVKPPLTGLQMK